MAGQGSFVLLFLAMMFAVSCGCFIRNCPIGGKRSVGGMSSGLGSHHACMSCGPAGLGQCVGPDICCGTVVGCFIGTEESAVCRQENDSPLPCVVEGEQCGADGQSKCVAQGVCCNDESCILDRDCVDTSERREYSSKSEAGLLPHDVWRYMRQLISSRGYHSTR